MKKFTKICLVCILIATVLSAFCVLSVAKDSPEATTKYSTIDNDADNSTNTKYYSRRSYPTHSHIYIKSTTKKGEDVSHYTKPPKINQTTMINGEPYVTDKYGNILGEADKFATDSEGRIVTKGPLVNNTTVINGEIYVTDNKGNVIGKKSEFATDKDGYYIINPADVSSDKSDKSPSTGSKNSLGIIFFTVSMMCVAAGAVICDKKKKIEE